MTIRQSILEAIRSDFLAVQTTNGFLGNIDKVFQTFKDLSSIKEADLPAVHITSLPASAVHGENGQMWKWDIAFITYFSVNRDAGDGALIETASENYIQDIQNKFLDATNLMNLTMVESVNVSLIDTYPQEELNTVGVVYGIITITYFN
jgi:hypothetical protein